MCLSAGVEMVVAPKCIFSIFFRPNVGSTKNGLASNRSLQLEVLTAEIAKKLVGANSTNTCKLAKLQVIQNGCPENSE